MLSVSLSRVHRSDVSQQEYRKGLELMTKPVSLPEAFRMLRAAAALGHRRANVCLAYFMLNPWGTMKANYMEAIGILTVEWHESNNPLAILLLGQMYNNDDTVLIEWPSMGLLPRAYNVLSADCPTWDHFTSYVISVSDRDMVGCDQQKIDKAYKTLKRLGDLTFAPAVSCLGLMAQGGFGPATFPNIDLAVSFFERASDQGYVPAMCNLACALEMDDDEPRESVKLYRRAAAQNFGRAHCNLGVCLSLGRGVRLDIDEAVRQYKLGAEQGYLSALCNLGSCYLDGNGVEKNCDEAVRLFRVAQAQDVPRAHCLLGNCYFLGQGVKEDPVEAVRLYQLAMALSYDHAGFGLGRCFYTGKGIKQDFRSAVVLFYQAAQRGHSGAQCYLGLCYEQGVGGLPVDRNRAYELITTSARRGNKEAATHVIRMNRLF
jgi:TPR repeat protein